MVNYEETYESIKNRILHWTWSVARNAYRSIDSTSGSSSCKDGCLLPWRKLMGWWDLLLWYVCTDPFEEEEDGLFQEED